ncbi:uncharacterized protein LOC122867066 [Siniperca chuatsi]|uniref:uncharacterized protein LOC122867066 n=1 Tax=Siniperca chuatsi TaxID=119488 RepID=UPI001CE13A94|nr:uncharacterized protein LOC122867066 [Siniperca chuatsi]
MVMDYRKNPAPPTPITLCNSPVDTVESFRFLGTIITHDLKVQSLPRSPLSNKYNHRIQTITGKLDPDSRIVGVSLSRTLVSEVFVYFARSPLDWCFCCLPNSVLTGTAINRHHLDGWIFDKLPCIDLSKCTELKKYCHGTAYHSVCVLVGSGLQGTSNQELTHLLLPTCSPSTNQHLAAHLYRYRSPTLHRLPQHPITMDSLPLRLLSPVTRQPTVIA